jgi:hypothetical protein
MNQEPIVVKLLTQSKPIQYLFIALSIILVVWSLKGMLKYKDDIEGFKGAIKRN